LANIPWNKPVLQVMKCRIFVFPQMDRVLSMRMAWIDYEINRRLAVLASLALRI
jgi:hypothetical protein